MDPTIKLNSYEYSPVEKRELKWLDQADGTQDGIITKEGLKNFEKENPGGVEHILTKRFGTDTAEKVRQVQQGQALEVVGLYDEEPEPPKQIDLSDYNPIEVVKDAINEYIIYPAQDFIDDTITTPITDALNKFRR